MEKVRKHLKEGDVRKILSEHNEEVQPYFELVEAFNIMFDGIMFERFIGIKKRTKIILTPNLAFNLAAKQGLRNRIELNLGVFPLVKALVISVSKLDFVCTEIPSNKSFDQEKAINDMADIFNVIYYQMDSYNLDDEHISELLDESDLGTRSELTYSLFKKMLYYLLCHEYAHIRCRHASKVGRKNITEFQVNSDYSNGNTDFNARIHWAELEADHFGADLMVEMLRVFGDSLPGQPPRPISDEEAKELRQILLVIGLLFLSFSYRPEETTSISFYRMCNYPHPCVRLANVFDILANFISGMYSIEMESVIDVMSDVLYTLIRIAQTVGIREFDTVLSNIDEVRKEIHGIQGSIERAWIDKSNKAMSDTFLTIRKSVAVV